MDRNHDWAPTQSSDGVAVVAETRLQQAHIASSASGSGERGRTSGLPKKILALSARLQAEYAGKEGRLCFQDEARFGLKPTFRRVWTKRGQRPTAPSKVNYEWTSLYGVVEPASGRVFWCVLPNVNVTVMNVLLREYAASLPNNVIALMVLDGAGWHSAKKLQVPPNIVMAVLPPSTPELNPAERLWTFVREATHHQVFADLDALEERLCARCVQLDAQPQVISSATSHHGYFPGNS